MATAWLSFYFGIFIFFTCLMNCTQSTNCHTEFKPYKCQFLPQSDETLIFPCKVYNNAGCKGYMVQVPPKDLKLNTVHLEFINIYYNKYQDGPYDGETYPALNFTISLPNDMLQSCRALHVNIRNNGTSGNYGENGICRLFEFNMSSTLWRKRKKIQPAYINHNCFTATVDEHYYLKFTTLPFATEIIYSIIIKSNFIPPATPKKIILAVAPVHHRLAINVILGVPVGNICENRFILTSFKTKSINLTNNSFVFENLQAGIYTVRVESSCFAGGHYIESENILLKNISEPKSLFNGSIIWIFLSLVPTFVLIICLYEYFSWKQKCIDRSHKCVIDLLYAGNMGTIADHLKKLMEEEFEWSVNNVQIDYRLMTCKCEMATNDVALYLTAPDMHGRVMFPNHFKIIHDIHTSENVIKALLFYTLKNSNQISVDFTPSFDIVKDIKRLFYFVYKATKSYHQVKLFHETHYPNVNYIEKLKSWKRFVDLIKNIDENTCSISALLQPPEKDI